MNIKALLTDKKKRIMLISALVCAVVAILCAVFIIVSSVSKAKNTDADISSVTGEKITAPAGDDKYDPENNELHSEKGQNVSAENLEHKKGAANGIDVSKWQGKIDWGKAKKAGIDFAVIRIGYRGENGQLYKDSAADYNLQQAEKAGILTGVYFFSTAVTEDEAVREAEWTVKAIAGYSISYPVVYDCEGYLLESSRMNGVTAADRTKNALAFLRTVKAAGYEAMLYGNINELSNSACWDISKIENEYSVWVAQYPSPPYPQTAVPAYSGKYDMWQYTDCGGVDGISGNCDMNVSYFTRKKAEPKSKQRPQTAEAPKATSDDYTETNEQITAKEFVNLRDMPSTKGNIAATLNNGEFAIRIGIGDNGWSKLLYNGQTVYAITSYLTTDAGYVAPKPQEADIVNGQSFTAASGSVTAKEETNLRALPTTEGILVGTIRNGEFVTLLATGDKGWSRLQYNGQTVYAVSSLLTTEVNTASETPQPQSEFTEVSEQVTAKSETNLRTAPVGGDGSEIVYTLKNGEYVTRTGVSDRGWSRLIYNGQTVYAITSYLTQ